MVYVWMGMMLPAFSAALGVTTLANWRHSSVATRWLAMLFLFSALGFTVAAVAFMTLPRWTSPG